MPTPHALYRPVARITFSVSPTAAQMLGLDDPSLLPGVVLQHATKKALTYRAPLQAVLNMLDELDRRADPNASFDQPASWRGAARTAAVRIRAAIAPPDVDPEAAGEDVCYGRLAEHAVRNAAWNGLSA